MGSRRRVPNMDVDQIKVALEKYNWNYMLVAMNTGFTAKAIKEFVERHNYLLIERPEIESSLRYKLYQLINHPDPKVALKGMNMYTKVYGTIDIQPGIKDDGEPIEITF